MSLKKGYCTHCHPEEFTNAIFDVNSSAKVCYCPHCMAELTTGEAISNYETMLHNKVVKAKKILYGVKDYGKAYEMFANILAFDPESIEARFGRLLSLLYMSTLRRDRFEEFTLMLGNDYASYFSKMSDLNSLFLFMNKCSIGLDEYEYLVYKKLSYRSYFYDADCLKLYFEKNHKLLKARESLLALYELSMQKLDPNSVSKEVEKYHQDIIDDVEKSKRYLEKKQPTMEGFTYKFVGFNALGKAMIARNDEEPKRNPTKVVNATLDEEAKHIKIISNNIYPNNIGIYKASRGSLPLFIVFYLFTAGLICSFIFFKEKTWSMYFLIGAGVFLLGGLVCMIFHLAFKTILKRYRHLIN